MFNSAVSFNQDLSGWDVSNVTDMSYMFRFAESFNQDLSGWDVSNVTNMRYMFYSAPSFNQDLSGWDVSNVTDMNSMFYYAVSFNQDLSGWDVSNVTNMGDMFTHNFDLSEENRCIIHASFSSNDYWTLPYDWLCEEEVTYQVGDYAEGGIVFYVDETGRHGLVSAMEDLTEGATPFVFGQNGYEWGCYETIVLGADGQAIGTGYQNTMDVVNQECSTNYGGITAAQAALDFEINGYSDWYLPSKDELEEMYNTIGNGGPEGNIGGFATSYPMWYWTSSEYIVEEATAAWTIYFDDGSMWEDAKDSMARVRAIRAF